ncbi:glycosyltransferase [Parafrigoribacterium soli]|uniref:glycosyltransferase n=1 Tax=Parafrigoribacterium soli TaxID=3144663 RepID=UPI0032EDC0C8
MRRALAAELRALVQRGAIRDRTVLYESFEGNGVLCNPEAIFRELLRSVDLRDLTHTWVLDSLHAHQDIQKEFAHNPRVQFVRYRSLQYFRALATSKFLVNNATFPPEFGKRPGQIYLNTWHGTPLKHMGYDMPNGAMGSANTLRNFVSADYLLSQNSFMTERMYEKAYRLRGIYTGKIIEAGYPRVDHQFLGADAVARDRSRLGSAGLDLRGRRIVLFAPTWKGDSFTAPEDDARLLLETVQAVQQRLGADEYVVLLKTHQVVHRFAVHDPALARVLVPNDIPTNAMLGLSDILITDYSSIFFDFLASDRPIVFYTPDASAYSDSRGTYLPTEQLPGPSCFTVDELAEAVREAGSDRTPQSTRDARYRDAKERFTTHDDGSAAERVVDIVFRGNTADPAVLSISDDTRIPVLLHLGGMRSNGITSAALNLLGAIDHDRYDVSAVFARPRGAQQRANQARIDPRVRQFHRMAGMNGSKVSHLRRKVADIRHEPLSALPALQHEFWNDEWRRCFGQSRFDSVIDFSGYSPFWARLLLHSPEARRSIWLHNDIVAEADRVIRRRRRMRVGLRAVFALYESFDALVSVSPSLDLVNRASLLEPYGLRAEQFVAARNLVNNRQVIEGIAQDVRELAQHPVDAETGEIVVPDWARSLATDDGLTWFVTVGRFSPEKNQARLLRAFAAVHRDNPNTRLLLVGYGPLRSSLETLRDGLGLAGAAFLVGPYANPFAIVAAADCFVLSSNYEGQPMVILEAAIVGLPIVSVDFNSIHDALPHDGIHVVAQDDDALAEGMRDFLAGSVAPCSLDAEDYNREAIGEFYDVAVGRALSRV